MHRRTFIGSVTSCVLITTGCLNSHDLGVEVDNRENIESAADAPSFEVDNDSAGEFILLRNQPQKSDSIMEGDELEVSVYLGNSGGEPATGKIIVELVPPTESDSSQSDTILIEEDEELPSGVARPFKVGPFTMTTSGNWELIANYGVEKTHQRYDPEISVKDASSS